MLQYCNSRLTKLLCFLSGKCDQFSREEGYFKNLSPLVFSSNNDLAVLIHGVLIIIIDFFELAQ